MTGDGPATANRDHSESGATSAFPAYGPIDAALSYGLFVVFVDRATPTVVDVFSEDVLDLPPSLVRFATATLLWFVLAVAIIDQVRKQLAALGVGSYDAAELQLWSSLSPSPMRTAGYAIGAIVGAAVAALTFERAIDTGVSLIRIVATLDVAAFYLLDFVVLVVFFLAFGAATHSIDRLAIDGIRALLAD